MEKIKLYEEKEHKIAVVLERTLPLGSDCEKLNR